MYQRAVPPLLQHPSVTADLGTWRMSNPAWVVDPSCPPTPDRHQTASEVRSVCRLLMAKGEFMNRFVGLTHPQTANQSEEQLSSSTVSIYVCGTGQDPVRTGNRIEVDPDVLLRSGSVAAKSKETHIYILHSSLHNRRNFWGFFFGFFLTNI